MSTEKSQTMGFTSAQAAAKSSEFVGHLFSSTPTLPVRTHRYSTLPVLTIVASPNQDSFIIKISSHRGTSV